MSLVQSYRSRAHLRRAQTESRQKQAAELSAAVAEVVSAALQHARTEEATKPQPYKPPAYFAQCDPGEIRKAVETARTINPSIPSSLAERYITAQKTVGEVYSDLFTKALGTAGGGATTNPFEIYRQRQDARTESNGESLLSWDACVARRNARTEAARSGGFQVVG